MKSIIDFLTLNDDTVIEIESLSIYNKILLAKGLLNLIEEDYDDEILKETPEVDY